MIRKRHPHIVTYVATYLVVAVAIGGALFLLNHTYMEAQRRAAEAAAKQEPPPPTPVPKPEPKPEPLKSAPAPAPKPEILVKKPEPPPPPAPDPMEEINRMVEAMHPMPVIRPLLDLVGNWRSVPPNAFPNLVALKVPVNFEVTRNGAVMARGVLPAGSSVAPLDLDVVRLRIKPTPTSSIVTFVHVDQTDFKEKIQERYDAFVRNAQAAVMTRRAQERERTIRSRNLEVALSKYGNGEDPRFDPMKSSIRRGEAGFYQVESADRWRWAGKETVDGVEYDTGLVMMVSESAFGASERELKALMLAGKVVRWLDSATGKPL